MLCSWNRLLDTGRPAMATVALLRPKAEKLHVEQEQAFYITTTLTCYDYI